MSFRPILAVLPLAGLLAAVPADPPAAPPPAFECRWADAPVNLDGAADEPAWKRAQAIDSFHLFGEKAKAGTRAKLLWDRDYLYFFADLDDSDLVSDDALALFVKPAADRPGYFEFRVTAAGTVSDRFYPKRDLDSLDKPQGAGEFPVEAKVTLR